MDPSTLVNKPVDVIAVYKKNGGITALCYPYRMKYEDREITFTELGLRHPTAKGKRMIHVFDMTDGSNDYRLEFDAERLTWTLVAILGGHHEVQS